MPIDAIRPHRCALSGWQAVSAVSSRTFGRHSHDTYGIGVIERGAQRSLSACGVVEAGPGDLIMVNPGEVHDGVPFDREGRAWIMAYVEPRWLMKLAEEGGVRRVNGHLLPPVVRDPELKTEVSNLFHRLVSATLEADTLEAEVAACTTVATLLKRHAHLKPRATPRAAIARCRQRIDDDPAAPLSLADLANEAGLSRFQVLRGFSSELGLTPVAYRMQRRIACARGLIERGHRLAEAAGAAGFADQSHMTRAFMRYLGYTPGALAAACNRVLDP